MVIFPPDPLPYYQNYAFREKFFSPEECERVIAFQNRFALKDMVTRREEPAGNPSELRRSRVAAVPWIPETEWVAQRLAAAAIECNKGLYNFALTGFIEGFQLEQFSAGSFYDWHQDFGFREMSNRKLSLIVQLSDGNQYQGGDVEFFSGRGSPQQTVRSRGSLLIFPAFVAHCVAPVNGGVRYCLNGWISGPAFR